MSEKSFLENNSVLFKQLRKNDHEQLHFCSDKYSGLKAIIAIHDTTLGPALGGTRMWNYASEEDAIKDVLRLSRGMTYKSAVSGLNLGGGKAVIIGNSATDKSEALMRRYGKFVETLNGIYITAEDVGTSPLDMQYINMETDHVVGLPESRGGGGDPSPVTAYGVYMGMKASAKKLWGKDSLAGKKVLVQGVGHVGEYLVKHLTEEKAVVAISDINEARVKEVASKYKTGIVDIKDVYDYDMDIYAPCALGATLNDDTIPKLKCKIVAGAANNQLDDEDIHGKMIQDRSIIYAPDFLINAGGIINCFSELEGYNRDGAMEKTEDIYRVTLNILNKAEKEGITTQQAAYAAAEERLEAIRNLNAY